MENFRFKITGTKIQVRSICFRDGGLKAEMDWLDEDGNHRVTSYDTNYLWSLIEPIPLGDTEKPVIEDDRNGKFMEAMITSAIQGAATIGLPVSPDTIALNAVSIAKKVLEKLEK